MLLSFSHNQIWDINFIHLGVTRVCDTNHGIGGQLGQEDIHVLLERLTKSQFGIRSHELPIWCWDPGIARSDKLLLVVVTFRGVQHKQWDIGIAW